MTGAEVTKFRLLYRYNLQTVNALRRGTFANASLDLGPSLLIWVTAETVNELLINIFFSNDRLVPSGPLVSYR
jgi:hypothetical protein